MAMKRLNVLRRISLLSICVLSLACSQNNSDKPASEALAELGLTALAAPATTDGPAAAEAIVGGYGAPDSENGADGKRQTLANVTVAVPEGWRSVPPSSSMRVAEYVLPSSPPGADASVAIFSGNMGSVEDNIGRWKGQFEAGSTSETRATSISDRGTEMAVAVVDISGTFTGGMGPNAGSAQDNSRMLGAIVDVERGSTGSRFLYIKLLGPRETVAQWASSFDEFIQNISQL
jgi:hypothetical protein